MGRDTRESGDWIAEEIIDGLKKRGLVVWNIGIVSTPCVAYLSRVLDGVNGGIMITASHNPVSDNGVKVFDGNGDKFDDNMELEVEEELADGELVEKSEIVEKYENALLEERSIEGVKICLDSASGGAYVLAKEIFGKGGAEVSEISDSPNGQNINENAGALFPENASEKMGHGEFDFGVALDGDADRVILIDETGRIWDGDRIVAMLVKEFAVNKVVMTEYSNLGAVQYLQGIGVEVLKVVVGDKEVVRKCRENNTRLGGEAAGHIIDLDWLSSSDGMYVAVLVADMLKKRQMKLSELWPNYEDYPQKIWNIKVTEKKPLEEIAGWSEAYEWGSGKLGNEGRAFARYSGTEKKLRIMVEAKDQEKMNEVGENLAKIVQEEIGL